MTYLYVWHDSFLREAWLILCVSMRDKTPFYLWNEAFVCGMCVCVCVIWTICMRDYVLHMCAMTYLLVWCASFARVTPRISPCDVTYSYVCHDWFIWVACLISAYDACCSVLQCVAVCCSVLQYVAWFICMCDMSHFRVCIHVCVVRPTFQSAHCNTLQHTATHWNTHASLIYVWYDRHFKLQHTAIHCDTLQHIATHCNTHLYVIRSTLQPATHCNTLQHTATHRNTRASLIYMWYDRHFKL